MSFNERVVMPVRQHLQRSVRLPSVGVWAYDTDRGTPVLSLTLETALLCKNFQENAPASPFFLICFAFWYARITDNEPLIRLRIDGPVPTSGSALQHYRRACIALEALEVGLGDRISVSGLPGDCWPAHPVVNAPHVERSKQTIGGGREHKIEVQLTRELEHAKVLTNIGAPVTGFHRQLPLGLFEGEVASHTRWTPGQGAQADLWAVSPDAETFHLFELKVTGNSKVGILPELLTYAWLLHHIQKGFADSRRIAGGGPGAFALRRAKRLVAWTLAPSVHPLLHNDGDSPLHWLAEGLKDKVELGMLFYEDSDAGFAGWRLDETWRSQL